jgi:hypothetical protein
VALCLVELRGFEPLTPCMPSRDPHHSAHHKASRSRPFHQSMRAVVWWFVLVRRAELLRICCAKWRERRVHRGELLGRRSLAEWHPVPDPLREPDPYPTTLLRFYGDLFWTYLGERTVRSSRSAFRPLRCSDSMASSAVAIVL